MKTYEILLTDDDFITVEGVRANLETEGYHVTKASSGAMAIQKIIQKDFDLVITDLVMTPVNGMEVLKKAKEVNPDTMVIIFTGHADITSAIDALRLDADDYLTKPYEVDELFFRVSRCLEKREYREKMKATQEALQESEKNFRALAENANDGILIAVGKGNHVYANQRAHEITGHTIPELLLLRFADLAHPDELRKIREQYDRKLADQPALLTYETAIIRKQGKAVPVEVTAAKTVWQGKPAFLAFIRDITERKRANEKLRQKDNAIESSINAIIFCDLQYQVTYVNKSFLELWGYDDVQEVLSRKAGDFWQDDDKFLRQVSILWEQGNWIGESLARRKDGSSFYAQTSASMVTDEKGKPVSMMASFIDISEKKQMEAALRKSNEELERRVEKRALKLIRATGELERKQRELLYHKMELEKVNTELVETNKALSVLAKNIERKKGDTERRLAQIISSGIIPIAESLKKDERLEARRSDLDLLSAYLFDLTSDISRGTDTIFSLSITELRIATMIKNGLKSKEISSQLNISLLTVKTHRKRIRKKLNLQRADINLAAYLRSKLD